MTLLDKINNAMGWLRDTLNSSAFFVLITVLTAGWACIVFVWPIEFWYSGDEYAYLSLAHALHLEIRLRDGLLFNDSGLGNHPGIPLYFVSWICLRVVALLTGHRDTVAYVLADPTAFFFATRCAAGLIALASAAGAYHVLSPLEPWKRTVAVLSFFAVDTWSLIYGMTSLGNETFALPLAVVFFWSVNKVSSAPKDAWLPWLYVGCTAGLGYLIKPTYLSILAGALALACTMTALYPAPTGLKVKFLCARILVIVGSFVALTGALILIVSGRSEFSALIKGHKALISSTALLGGGLDHRFSLEGVLAALKLLSSTWLPFAIGIATASLAVVIYLRWRSRTMEDREWLWSISAVAACGFASLAILSHFRSYYYMPAISCFLPFILKPVLAQHGLAVVATIAVLVVGAESAKDAATRSANLKAPADRMKADEATIDSMPLASGEARLWTYGLSGRVFVREFVLQLAGIQAYIHAREPDSKDIASYAYVVRPYRYIVFARGSYVNIETLRDRAARNRLTQPNGMTVTIGDDAIYRQLKETIVVEIPAAMQKK